MSSPTSHPPNSWDAGRLRAEDTSDIQLADEQTLVQGAEGVSALPPKDRS